MRITAEVLHTAAVQTEATVSRNCGQQTAPQPTTSKLLEQLHLATIAAAITVSITL